MIVSKRIAQDQGVNNIPEGYLYRSGYFVNLAERYGADMEDWGKINNYQSLDKPETIHAWLSKVFVECFAKERDKLLKPAMVQKYAKKMVYALQIIKPDVIRIPSEEVINDICEVKESVSFNEDGRPQVESRISCVMKQADGYAKLVELCKKLKISLTGLDNVKDNVMRVRHRVIHGGYVPTYEEANMAYSETRKALRVLGVAMFE